MNCPKCGFTVNENDAFCRACGANVRPYMQNNQVEQPVQNIMNSQPSQGYDYHSQFQSQNNNNQSYDINNPGNNYYADLIDAYIGKNADKIKSGKFSCTTLFFGILYVFYRKMWALGFIWWISAIIISIFLPKPASLICTCIEVIIATQFNKIYFNKVKEKVNKIMQQNPGKTKDELKTICAKKGGTTIIPVIIVIVIYIAIIGFATSIVMGTINDVTERANCLNEGGAWVNGKCKMYE